MVIHPVGRAWQVIRRGTWIALSMLVLAGSLAVTPLLPPDTALAAGSCQVTSVSPQTAASGSDTGFSFSILDNTDNLAWVRVTSPSGNLIIVNAWSDWLPNVTVTTADATFSGSPISAGNTLTVNVEGIVSYFPTASWTVEASTDQGGASPMTCSGNTSLTVTDTTPPNIGNVTVTPSTTSAVISWDTDKATTGEIDYGTTTTYTNQALDNTSSLSHSLTISGLTAGTAYHYMITATDQSANTSSTADSTFFTTPLPSGGGGGGGGNTTGTSSTPPGGSLNTKVTNPGDKSPPSISLTSNIPRVFTVEPTLSGTASDNSSVVKVEYSVDGGTNWLPADTATGLGSKKVTFTFTPLNLDDGTYQLSVRAIDGGGNTTATPPVQIVIDRFPPTVGGNVIALGPQILVPDSQGVTTTTIGTDLTLTLSSAGGATKISAVATNSMAKSSSVSANFALHQASGSGLWSGTISFSKPGLYQLAAHAVDGAGNTTDRTIAIMNVVRGGTVLAAKGPVANAQITIYTRDPDSGGWVVWDGSPYAQTNPQKTLPQGNFQLFLPAGTYYLHVTARGYQDITSSSFRLTDPTPVVSAVYMQPTLTLGPLSLSGLSFGIDQLSTIHTTRSNTQKSPEAALIGNALPDIKLDDTAGQTQNSIDWLGKPTLVTLLTTWAPSSAEQLSELDKLAANTDINIKVIGLQENAAKLRAYDAIDGSTLTWLADPNNQTVSQLQAGTIPMHIFINRKGVVTRIVHGVLDNTQIISILEDQ